MNNMDILMYEEMNKERKPTLAEYIFENYALGGSTMLVRDILKYVDEKVDNENKVEVLCELLYSIGITEMEIRQYII